MRSGAQGLPTPTPPYQRVHLRHGLYRQPILCHKRGAKSIEIQEKIRNSLEKLATGYDYEEREIVTNPQGKPEKIRIIKKHAPPRMEAIREVQALMAMGAWK